MHDQKILYIDCSFGAAGDMLGAALLDLMEPSQRVACIEELNSLGVPSVKFLAESAFRAGIVGSSLRVIIDGIEEDEHLHDHTHAHAHAHIHSHSHDHSHDHGHSHGDGHHHDHSHEHAHSHSHTHDYVHDHAHVHRGLADIEAIIGGLKMSDSAKASACGIYRILAEAEGHAHGMPVSEIHFHEVGTMDAIADITAFSYLIEKLDIDRIVASPVGVGSGQVRCAHGILPVPAPATAQILSGVPMTATDLKGELCTPTGAAILKYFATEFGAMPAMTVEATGYGMGKKDFEWANCVRLMLGAAAGTEDRIIELSCNLDDMTAESIAFAMERIFAAGAVDVITTPAGMKKNRPGTVLTALCREDAREAVVEAFFKHTTTLGIREAICRRYILARDVEVLDTPYGQVRRKIAKGYGVERYKYEYDDISRIARETGMTLEEVKAAIE